MTRFRIGIDVVSVSRLDQRLTEWPKLAQRIFSPAELQYAQSRPDSVQHLAVRFAAKEAAFKALGTGWPSLSWLDVEVVSTRGRPLLAFSGKAAVRAGECTPLVSLSHDGGVAVAQVVLVAAGD